MLSEEFVQWYRDIHPTSIDDSIRLLVDAIAYRPPSLTTVRVDVAKYSSLQVALDEVCSKLASLHQSLTETLSEEFVKFISKFDAWIDAEKFPDVIFISTAQTARTEQQAGLPNVVVDRYTGQAVLRGSNVFAPGIITADHFSAFNFKANLVNVFVERGPRLLVGERIRSLENLAFLGFGVPIVPSREGIMKLRTENIRNGAPVIQMLTALFPMQTQSSHFYLQNLPSILASHVLFNACSKHDGKILDACSGYGGKTKHLAELFPNAQIIAVERSRPKAEACASLFQWAKCANVAVIEEDVVKLTRHGPFDAILLDPPCSGLGQRPTFSSSPF